MWALLSELMWALMSEPTWAPMSELTLALKSELQSENASALCCPSLEDRVARAKEKTRAKNGQ
jgi:hypothetical protein